MHPPVVPDRLTDPFHDLGTAIHDAWLDANYGWRQRVADVALIAFLIPVGAAMLTVNAAESVARKGRALMRVGPRTW